MAFCVHSLFYQSTVTNNTFKKIINHGIFLLWFIKKIPFTQLKEENKLLTVSIYTVSNDNYQTFKDIQDYYIFKQT